MEFERYMLIYKIMKNDNCLRLLSEEFFNRSKNSGHFIYKNRKFRLCKILNGTKSN